jgi:endonuclease YncB( thermonuclease family)
VSLPYHLVIKGELVVIGKEPDGDSVRFVADDPSRYQQLQNGHRVRLTKSDGSVQLRFEGVDAPELHYGPFAQPLGERARNELLRWVGFSHVEYEPGSTKVTGSEPGSVRAAILSKAVEVNGRPVAFVLLDPAARRLRDGAGIVFDRLLLEKTLNWRLLTSGLAYYTVYSSTPLRDDLRAAALRARRANHGRGKGVWAIDSTGEYRLVDQDSIGPSGALILPKLFRRSTDYLKAVAQGFGGNLADWMISTSTTPHRSENDRVVLADGTEVHFSDLLSQRNATIVFQPDLLEIVFVEK